MVRGLYTADTGMINEQKRLDVISNNLANSATVGYKEESVSSQAFDDVLTIKIRDNSVGYNNQAIGTMSLGVKIGEVYTDYGQGAFVETGNTFDFAIDGNGFFTLRCPTASGDSVTRYTRNGNFTWAIDANGRTLLTDSEGCPVLDSQGNEIMVPQGISAERMIFNQDGSIAYKDASGNPVLLNQSFGIYQFNNPAGLEKTSSSRLIATAASGNPMLEGATNGISSSKVLANYLEGSNVQVADEMVNMIIAQRAYELNSKAITTADSMLDTANNLKR